MIEKETFKRTTYARTDDGEIEIIEKYEFYDKIEERKWKEYG